tara:strand:+ start:231 stop:452 length:222 start_codon:yes stop_codon:yes gene_type:complete
VPLVDNIYENLIKDPDLEIMEGQTRHDAAKSEAESRTRQHYNNIEALSLASEPLKKLSPLKQFIFHVSKLNED